MAGDKLIALITGANGGIGFELAAQLLAKGNYHVLLGSRSVEKGNAALKELKSHNYPGSVELLQVDLEDDASIDAAAKTVESKFGYLDILVNNAAIAISKGSTLREKMNDCFNTNATGIAVMGYTFQPLLRKSPHSPRMISVSSGGGSVTLRNDPNAVASDQVGPRFMPYRASKAAENMVTGHLSAGFKADKDDIKVFSYCPGFTVSNLSHMNKMENGAKSTADGVRPMVDIIEGKRDAETDGFLHEGGQYSW